MEQFIMLLKNKDTTVQNGYGLPAPKDQLAIDSDQLQQLLSDGELEIVDGQYFMSPDRETWFMRSGQSEARVDEEALAIMSDSDDQSKRKHKRKGVMNDLVRRTRKD